MPDTDPSPSSGAITQANRALVMRKAFSPNQKEDWSSWIKYFRTCASLNKWSDEENVISSQFDFAVRLRKRTRASATRYKREHSTG